MPSSNQQERYTFGYGQMQSKMMSQRTASREAAFILPYLEPGMTVLDGGCGPGTITMGLAKAVTPGEVTGIDLGESQINSARQLAQQESVTNVQFQTASIYELPFADATFDVAFLHAVLEHLNDPVKALKEVYRVLKQEGIVGLRSPDQGSNIYHPGNEKLYRSQELVEEVPRRNGGDRRIGRQLRNLLNSSGFDCLEVKGSCFSMGTPHETKIWGETVALAFSSSTMANQMVEWGIAEKDEVDSFAEAWKEWGLQEGAFFASIWCEAIGEK